MAKILTTAVVLAMCALCASAAMPMGKVLVSSGQSSLVLSAPSGGNVVLTATLGPCTGLQIHTHNETEYAMADSKNAYPILMSYIDPNAMNPTVQDVMPGTTFVIPASFIHYQINYHCRPLVFHATLKADASTQLVLSTLDMIPTKDFAVYATTAAAMAKQGFFGTDASCLKSCAKSG